MNVARYLFAGIGFIFCLLHSPWLLVVWLQVPRDDSFARTNRLCPWAKEYVFLCIIARAVARSAVAAAAAVLDSGHLVALAPAAPAAEETGEGCTIEILSKHLATFQ